MELRHLRYFVAVASHGSFKRAAEILHITQPPLSRQIRDLELELEIALFERGPNSLRLTGAGELFFEEAREVLARADEAVRRVKGEGKIEVIRVGYAPSMTAGILSPVIGRFQSAVSGVRIELSDLSSREISDFASEGKLDLVICPGVSVANGIPGFCLTELRRLDPVFVVSDRHPMAKLKRIPVARLDKLPLVGLAKTNYPEYLTAIRQILNPHGISPRFVAMVKDGISTLLEELEARNAAAILTEGVIGILPRSFTARPLSPKMPSLSVVIGIPAHQPKPYVEAFAQMLIREAKSRTTGQ